MFWNGSPNRRSPSRPLPSKKSPEVDPLRCTRSVLFGTSSEYTLDNHVMLGCTQILRKKIIGFEYTNYLNRS